MTWVVPNLHQGSSFADSLVGRKSSCCWIWAGKPMMVEEGLVGESGGERCSRDLLQRFRLCDGIAAEKLSYKSPNDKAEELELSLGLSLGGRFGTEKSSKRLARSSSVTGSIPFMWEEKLGSTDRQSASFPLIFRTCSLPTEAEEKLRKRKEWQSLRRMEVKRRRCERQRKGGEKDHGDEIMGQATINFVDMPNVFGNGKAPGVGMSLPSVRLQGSAAIVGGGLIGDGGVVDLGSKGKEGILGVGDGSYGFVGYGIVNSLGLVDNQHGSSSGSGGGSDSDGKPTQGSSISNETKSPASNGLLQERINVDSVVSHAAKTPKEGMQVILPHRDVSETKPKAPGARAMEDMPSVFTKGDGPNGVRVDGILYKYGKGEEVRIMCVCHGKFLSPAEFVKHAGGGDVAIPRRHIFIDTSTVFSQ